MATAELSRVLQEIEQEISFQFSRSSGPGGQNINKVNSKVTASWDIPGSKLLTTEQKDKLVHSKALEGRLNQAGVLMVSIQTTRSQALNRVQACQTIRELVLLGLTPQRKRKKTRVPSKSKEKRLTAKKHRATKISNRARGWE